MKPRSRLSAAIAVTVLACLSVFITTAPDARAAVGMEVAVQDDQVFVIQLPNPSVRHPQARGLELASGIQATWVRANVDWYYVTLSSARNRKPPKTIRYNWTGYDYLVNAAAARGQHVQLSLTGTAPAWATGDHKPGVVRPSISRFRQFARDAAVHFKGRVSRYSIWNEPNYALRLAPAKAAPSLYRRMYSAAYDAIKGVDPSAQVLIGETSPEKLKRIMPPLAFLRAVTCANARYQRAGNCSTLRTDGYAHHPYDYRHWPSYKFPGADNVTLATLGRLTSALDKLQQAGLLTTPGGAVPEVYLTEYGYFASGKYKLPAKKQGEYLVQAFKMAQANPRVRQLLQYLVIKPPSKYQFFDTSIAGRNGKGTAAYNMLAAWAANAASAGQIARLVPPGGGGGGGNPPPPPPNCAPLPTCPPPLP